MGNVAGWVKYGGKCRKEVMIQKKIGFKKIKLKKKSQGRTTGGGDEVEEERK